MSVAVVLNDDQRNLAATHIDIVKWVIYGYIEVNENIYGFGYDDLFQEGCIWLCKAAATYDSKTSQFKTYATTVVKNGLIAYCRRMCKKQKNIINLYDIPLDSDEDDGETYADRFASNDEYDSLISHLDAIELLESVKSEYDGVALLGIEALELKVLGYSGADIARLWGVRQNHVGAWITRAKRKLMQNEKFMLGLG